jgi:hypothetical protein
LGIHGLVKRERHLYFARAPLLLRWAIDRLIELARHRRLTGREAMDE